MAIVMSRMEMTGIRRFEDSLATWTSHLASGRSAGQRE